MNNIHKINKDKGNDAEAIDSSGSVSSVMGYSEKSIRLDPEDKDCLAKKVTITSEAGERHKYYIKAGNGGEIFNPWGMFSEGSQNRFAKYHGRPVWNFVQVSKKSFDYYLSFLSNRNPAWFNNAQREARNA